MTRPAWPLAVCVVAAGLATTGLRGQPSPGAAPAQSVPVPVPAPADDNRINAAQLDAWMTQYSNWGRWGAADELGAVNLITPAKRRQAAKLVRTGEVVSLSRQFTIAAGQAGAPFGMSLSTNPVGFATDRIDIGYHGITVSHLDALCHHAYKGKLYNGFSFSEAVSKDGGCARLGVGHLRDRLVTRAVLIDIPRLKGVSYLEPGTHVYREDIEAWERMAGVKIGPGDALLLHTGRWIHAAQFGPSKVWAGFDASFVPFLKERDVALLGSDGAQDVGTVAGFAFPVHRFALAALGVPILDNLELSAVAGTAARLKRWEFQVSVLPTNAANGSGSPVNPIASF